jgi:hypothetical protein
MMILVRVMVNLSQIACVSGDRLLIEGLFGELQRITLVEGLMLEVKGSNGILRMDMTEDELKRALSHSMKRAS